MNLFTPSFYNKLCIAALNARSISNKSAVIYDHIVDNKLDVLCVSENWISDGDISYLLLSSLLLPYYSFS